MNAREVKAKIDIPLENETIKKGKIITVSERDDDYVLWNGDGCYSIDKAYVGKTIRVISKD